MNEGSASITLSLLTMSATGGPFPEFGVASVTLPSPSVSCEGITGETGTVEEFLPMLAIEAETLVMNLGDGYSILPALTISADAITQMVASGEIDLPPPSIGASGLTGLVAEGDLEVPIFTLYGDDSPGLMDLPAFTLSAEGSTGWIGVSEVSLPAIDLSAIGWHEAVSDTVLLIPDILLEGLGIAGMVGHLDLALPSFGIDAQGPGANYGVADLSIPAFTLEGTGIVTAVEGTTGVTLPIIFMEATGSALEVTGVVANVVVMNLSNTAISEYQNYPFSDYFSFDGKLFGIKGDGIYLLEGTTDSGSDIVTEIEKTGIDMKSPLLKRATDVYLKFRSTGDLLFQMIADKKSHEYILNNGIPGLRTQKVEPGRGLKGRHLGFNIKNIKGSTIRLNELHFLIDLLKRRAHDE